MWMGDIDGWGPCVIHGGGGGGLLGGVGGGGQNNGARLWTLSGKLIE
jgi:hypothetical protein